MYKGEIVRNVARVSVLEIDDIRIDSVASFVILFGAFNAAFEIQIWLQLHLRHILRTA